MNQISGEEILKELKGKYYKKWIPHKIKNVTIEIVPLPRDIPILESHGYDPLNDVFSIKFKTGRDKYERRIDEVLSIFEDERGYITGINIYGVKGESVQTIKVIVKKQLEDILLAMKEKFESLEDRSTAYRALGKFDLNQRALNFIGELAGKDLDSLHAYISSV